MYVLAVYAKLWFDISVCCILMLCGWLFMILLTF